MELDTVCVSVNSLNKLGVLSMLREDTFSLSSVVLNRMLGAPTVFLFSLYENLVSI